MSYFLVKGINGFGNMISTLTYAFDLAQKSNRTLIIDWSHPEWKLGFDKYFEFKKDIKYMSYDIFLEKVNNKRNNKKLKIYPTQFEGKLDKYLIEIFPNIDSEPGAYNKLFGNVNIQIRNSNIDIIVFSYNYCGYNGLDVLFKNLIIKEPLNQQIEDKIKVLKNYKAIHIRQTDIKNESLKWVQDFIKLNFNENIYIATDNRLILDIYKKLHPNIYNFTTFYSDGKPLHIQELNLDEKNKINEDTISDLMILSRSSELKITPQKTIPWMSTYSLLALSLFNLFNYNSHKDKP